MNEQSLKNNANAIICDLGLTRVDFAYRFNFPPEYLRRLGKTDLPPRVKVPPAAIAWLENFVKNNGNVEPYRKGETKVSYKTVSKETNPPAKTESAGAKQCPKCGTMEHKETAAFCYICGSPLKTQGEIIVSKLQKIRSLVGMLPVAERDETRDTLIMAIEFINNNGASSSER